jgi:uncharacterized membrane protein
MVDVEDVTDGHGGDDHPLVGLTVFAILGAGFLALFAGVEWFWMIWVFGFAVVLPSIGIVAEHVLDDDAPAEESAASETDPLERLRERYATGELTEAEFERRVERLLETEDRETAREFARHDDHGDSGTERGRGDVTPGRELERERD